jgi:hypothetical protein
MASSSALELYLTSRPAIAGSFEMRDEFGNRLRTAGHRAVDALGRKQQRALDALPAAEGRERRAQVPWSSRRQKR